MKSIINILGIFAIIFVFGATTLTAGNGNEQFELKDFVVENNIEIENNLSMLEGIKYLVVVVDANEEVVSSQAFDSKDKVFSIDCTDFNIGMHTVKIMTQGAKPVVLPILKGGATPMVENIVSASDDDE